MYRVFQSFIDALTDGADEVSLRYALSEVAVAFGFPLFAYFANRMAGPTWLISNYAKGWTERYLRERYCRLDPVIVRARVEFEPFTWVGSADAQLTPVQHRFFDEASTFGIRHGITIPLRAEGTNACALTFADGERGWSSQRCVDRYTETLQLLAIYFHRHARRVLDADNRILAGVTLSKREYECLQWAARGKSAWEIGQILKITRRTASFHLDNARAKLDVRSITQAVALLAASKPRR